MGWPGRAPAIDLSAIFGDATVAELLAARSRSVEGGCVEWFGPADDRGYGRLWVSVDGRRAKVLAHRASYSVHVGPIGTGMTLDHLCRNPRCIAPAHLDPVDHRTNMLRGVGSVSAVQARKTHCIRGHKLGGDNVQAYSRARGQRECRECSLIRSREQRFRRQEARAMERSA
jgi:hypothetical protein